MRVEVPFSGRAACQVAATEGAVGHPACFLGQPPVMRHRPQGENSEPPTDGREASKRCPSRPGGTDPSQALKE